MTIAFVTPEQVKGPLRIDGDASDAQLELMIAAASERITQYLNSVSPFVGDTSEVRPVVQQATITLVGYMYRYPTGDEKKAYDPDTLPAPVTALLAGLRRKVLV